MNFKQTMRQVCAVWMQPIYSRKNIDGKKVLLSLLLLLPLIGLGFAIWNAAAWSYEKQVFAVLVGVGAELFVFIWLWYATLINMIAPLYSPANARATPHLKRILQLALGIPLLVFPLLTALAMSAGAMGRFDLMHVWLVVQLALFGFTLYVRHRGFMLFTFTLFFTPAISENLNLKWKEWIFWQHPAPFIALSIALSLMALQWIFNGRERLFKRVENFSRMQTVIAQNGFTAPGKSAQILSALYRFQLNRKLKNPSTMKSPLLFGLGSGIHLSGTMLPLLIVLLPAFFVVSLLSYFKHDRESGMFIIALPFFFTLLSCPALYPSYVTATLRQTRTEQALLSLVALRSSHRTQKKMLLGFVFQQYFLIWLLVCVVVFLVAHELTDSQKIVNLMYVLCAASLIPAMGLLRNYSQLQIENQSFMGFWSFVTLAVFAAGGCAVYFFTPLPIPLICVILITASALALRWQWNRVMTIPALFPVGRAV